MDGQVTVQFKQNVSTEENSLAVMILEFAHRHPEIVENKQIINCSMLKFPGKVAARFAQVDAEAEWVTIPPDDFIRIISKMLDAELVCDIVYSNGMKATARAPYLPVTLVADPQDPYILFDSVPQCHFTYETQNGENVFQLKPCHEMRRFMLECIERDRK